MDSKVLEKMINFRQNIHMYPQIGFEEYETRNKIVALLKEFGVDEAQMTWLEPTALFVDLKGKAQPSGKPLCIAYRADMDALSMAEANHNLPYRSKIEGKAHMCGHDGHMACLIAFVPIFMANLQKIPQDKTVRLLFQPSEEGPVFGAKKMVQDGCLEGVDEVYGFHQNPLGPVGYLLCKQGAMTSQSTVLQIKIIGTSGHGSEPEKMKMSVKAAVKFYQQASDFLDNLNKQKLGKFSCSLPVFHGGQKYNVISQETVIEGSIRSFEQGLRDIILEEFRKLLQEIKKDGFKYQLTILHECPMTNNSKLQTKNVLRVGRKFFGEDKVSRGEGILPHKGSEDFSYFTKSKPGAFFFLGSAKQNSPLVMIHNCNYNFNDDLIEPAAKFWWELVKDRFELSL